jgi:thiaminase
MLAANNEDSMNVSFLLEQHADAWRAATRHPFLDGVRDGTLPVAAFTAWLAQDYLFVNDELVFQARLLARTPRPAQATLVSGLVALEAELSWFEAQAAQRQLVLTAPHHPVTATYRALLRSLDEAAYPVAITALWAIERAYLEAWQSAAPGHPTYREFVAHWTVPAFADYVGGLERAADAALVAGDAEQAVEAAFLDVARLEREFWEMAWTGARL